MSSDEDEELAALRAQRAARLGGAAPATLSQLREQQRRAEAARDGMRQYAEERQGEGQRPAGRPGGGVRGNGDDDDDDDEDDGPTVAEEVLVEAAERMDDATRAALPMAFGKQEVKLARAEEVHGKTKRTGTGSGGAYGPPRPPGAPGRAGPAVGPPRPPVAVAAAAAAGSSKEGGGGELVGPPRPAAAADEEDGWLVGPPWPPRDASASASEGEDDGDGEEEEEEEEEEDPYRLPVGHEVTLSGGERAVVALDVEHSGSRVAVGSVDYSLRLYDFGGMKSDLRPFRELTPSDGHPVHAVSWSPTGDALLVVTGSTQAKVFSRDGKELGEFIRGDMYIRDMRNTKGHVASLTCGQWHPTDRFTAITGSEDGTVRVWDTHNILQKTVVKPTLSRPGRVHVTAVSYNSDGRFIAAGLMDGTIQVWGVGGKFGVSAAVGVVQPPAPQFVERQGWSYVSRPNQLARGAHEAGTEITGLVFSQDDHTMASRGMDGTLKLWDLRRFSKPLATFEQLPTNYASTNVIFSPDERLVITGTAASPSASGHGSGGSEGGGQVVFVDAKQLRIVRRLGMPSHVAALNWHHRLNQIFVGMGDRRSGSCRVLYDTTTSERGALAAVGRAPRKASPFDFQLPLLIKTPAAEPRAGGGRKRQRQIERMDALKSHKPDLGMAGGKGRQGRIGTTGGTLLTQHLLKQRGLLRGAAEELDPREAILRHADKDDEMSVLTAAYAKTQPKPIFAEPEVDEGDGAASDAD